MISVMNIRYKMFTKNLQNGNLPKEWKKSGIPLISYMYEYGKYFSRFIQLTHIN